MRFKIIAVGTRMPGWVEEGYRDYAKRLPRDFTVEMVELSLGPRGKNASTAKAIAKEGAQMLVPHQPRHVLQRRRGGHVDDAARTDFVDPHGGLRVAYAPTISR